MISKLSHKLFGAFCSGSPEQKSYRVQASYILLAEPFKYSNFHCTSSTARIRVEGSVAMVTDCIERLKVAECHSSLYTENFPDNFSRPPNG